MALTTETVQTTTTTSKSKVTLGIGDIVFSPCLFSNGDGKLIFQELNKPFGIGERISPRQADELATGNELELTFLSIKSIDVLMSVLEMVKFQMQDDQEAKAPKVKMARVLRTGEIVQYKLQGELTVEERKASCCSTYVGNEIMIEPREGSPCWRYMYDSEVELLS